MRGLRERNPSIPSIYPTLVVKSHPIQQLIPRFPNIDRLFQHVGVRLLLAPHSPRRGRQLRCRDAELEKLGECRGEAEIRQRDVLTSLAGVLLSLSSGLLGGLRRKVEYYTNSLLEERFLAFSVLLGVFLE